MCQALYLGELGREVPGALESLQAREGCGVGRLGAKVLGADLCPCQPGNVQSLNQRQESWAGSLDTWVLVLSRLPNKLAPQNLLECSAAQWPVTIVWSVQLEVLVTF